VSGISIGPLCSTSSIGCRPAPAGAARACDRSIANAPTPLRLALDAAVAEGLLDAYPAEQVVLPRACPCAFLGWLLRLLV
jgi:hypothetical protein